MPSVFVVCLFGAPPAVRAHCDTLSGPVVRAARVALERNDVAPLLVWVKEPQEAEVRQAFHKAMAVRGLNAAAQDLADRYFFETVVRLHRFGEGEPFTGLKEGDPDELVQSADEAVESGVIEQVVKFVTARAAAGVRERSARLLELQGEPGLAAGRRYVAAYVEFMHYLEALSGHAIAGSEAHRPPTATNR
jgi:hypothetical protein